MYLETNQKTMEEITEEMKTIRNDINLLIRKSGRLEENINILEKTFKCFEEKYEEVLDENEELKGHLVELKSQTRGPENYKCSFCTRQFDRKWKFQAHKRYNCFF